MNRRKFNKGKAFLLSRIILVREKKLIESNYDFLKCIINKNQLECRGKVQPTRFSREYEIKIVYNLNCNPKVYVVAPSIEYNDDIHMFENDKSLCLYHSKTDNFYWDFRRHHLYDTIIPWALEWFVYYELYLISGIWEHPYVEHRIPQN